MKHLFRLAVVLFIALQQYNLWNERYRLGILISAVEREQQHEHDVRPIDLIDKCALPKRIKRPDHDLGYIEQPREQ